MPVKRRVGSFISQLGLPLTPVRREAWVWASELLIARKIAPEGRVAAQVFEGV
jgi:hypothetical protein